MYDFIVSLLPVIVLGFILTNISIPPIIRVSRAKNLFDEPNSRKLNKSVVPTLGGVGIFIGMIISFIVFHDKNNTMEIPHLFGAIIMLFFIGLKDDILVISAKKKFLVQLAAVALLVFLGDIRIESMNDLFGLQNVPAWAGQFLAFSIILFLINAMNLVDGIDGLAGGISLLGSLFFGIWFYAQDVLPYAILSFALAGSLIAFLRFNLFSRENKIFMGDTGSLILGATLSVFVIKFINIGSATLSNADFVKHMPAVALSLLIVPVCDVLRVFTIRIRQGRSPFSADMNHVHHLLIKIGMTHVQSTCLLLGYTAMFLTMSLLFQNVMSVTTSFITIFGMSFTLIGLASWYNEKREKAKETQLKLTRKVLTIGITHEEERLLELINRRRLIIGKRA